MKYLLFFLLLLNFYSYSIEPQDILFKSINPYITQLEKTTDLKLVGSGGSMPSDIKNIFLDLEISRDFDIPQARNLYVTVVENLLTHINACRPVRPLLHDFPFTCRNIRLIIGSTEKVTKANPGKKICFMLMGSGNIYYSVYDLGKDDYVEVFEEPYEKALKIVQAEWERAETARAE